MAWKQAHRQEDNVHPSLWWHGTALLFQEWSQQAARNTGQQLLSERTFRAKTTIAAFGRHPSTITWVMVNNAIQEINSFGYLGST